MKNTKPTKTLEYKKLKPINTGQETKAVIIGFIITMSLMLAAGYGLLTIITALS